MNAPDNNALDTNSDREASRFPPGPNGARKVLVIGGGGVSGRRILDDLRSHAPELRLYASGRAAMPPSRPPLPAEVEWLRLDIDSLQPAQLHGFDLVVIAAGPFDLLRERAHRACIAAGVDAIDINDSLDAASAIHALDADAVAAGVRIVTGAGLSPGLSGLMLAGLRAERATATRLDSVLYMCAKNAGGASAPLALFGGFRRRQPCWRDGVLREAATDWRGAGEPYRFAHLDRAVACVPQASPELAALARSAQGVGEIRHRFHVQGLPPWFARLCAILDVERRPRLAQWLAARMHAAGAGVARKPASSPVCSLAVTDLDSGEQWRVHGEIPAYHLTASVAAMFALALLDGELSPSPGVHAPEWLANHLDWRAALARRGIVIERGRAGEAGDWPARIGLSSACADTPRSLRHYGQCWYSVSVPPWVQRWQMRCLTGSELYAQLKRRRGLPARMLLIARMLLDWRRDAARARALNAFGARETTAAAAAMRRDFAMFAAGYKRLRESLGTQVAAELYPQMFLDTGAMEMHWLTPSAAVFAARPDPGAALAGYMRAYFNAYADLGAIDLEIEPRARGLALRIKRCAFARLFTALDAPELAPLVRRMEARHFGAIAQALGLHLDYRDHSGGLARFSLDPGADASADTSTHSTIHAEPHDDRQYA